MEIAGLGQFTPKGPFNRMVPEKTKDGKFIGYRLIALDKTFKAMGLMPSDVIKEVDGVAFDSQDAMVQGMDKMVSGRLEKKFCILFTRKDQVFEKHFHLVPAPN